MTSTSTNLLANAINRLVRINCKVQVEAVVVDWSAHMRRLSPFLEWRGARLVNLRHRRHCTPT
jgi:hypothetical protein